MLDTVRHRTRAVPHFSFSNIFQVSKAKYIPVNQAWSVLSVKYFNHYREILALKKVSWIRRHHRSIHWHLPVGVTQELSVLVGGNGVILESQYARAPIYATEKED